mmetsp:Transcript_22299/g.33836  ORF Transcript_22299/g.33836 Transcript_22299/m.33836 type:complete len:572 (-) Transcript_22299:30-1745(-)
MTNSRIRKRLLLTILTVLSTLLIVCSANSIRKSSDNNNGNQARNPLPAKPIKPNNVPIITMPKKPNVPIMTHSDQNIQEHNFMEWCSSMGIQTNLTIKMFDYPNSMRDYVLSSMLKDGDDYDDDDFIDCDADDDFIDCNSPILHQLQEYERSNFSSPSIPVRGLAAQRDIAAGEVVISIPFSAMIAVPTTIDQDPVLDTVMGHKARQAQHWDDDYYGLPLLAVALLYHRRLGKASKLYHYIGLLETTPTENIPFLWKKSKLVQFQNEGIRRHAQGIRQEVKDMYHEVVVDVLQKDFPELFAADDTYSLHNFSWAFALINSRHWHLPIPDLNANTATPTKIRRKVEEEERASATSLSFGDQLPPASSPTEEWVHDQGELGDESEEIVQELHDFDNSTALAAHSFLAPVADLLNFGPPCTHGSYNTETRAFELVATCSFLKGQEVTYWYSDDCDDIIIANYGFTHPMVPPCPTVDDIKDEAEKWKRRSQALEEEIEHTFDDLDELEQELIQAEEVLERHNIKEHIYSGNSRSRKQNGQPSADHIRGTTSQSIQQRRSVRRNSLQHRRDDDIDL